MIETVAVQGFSAIPYLERTALMSRHQGQLKFSRSKPNVIVGPNGSGKSALLQALALRFLAYFLDASSFDNHYLTEPYWTNASRWGHEWEYLKGLTAKTDNAPALFYRPGHIPGNECDHTHAMLTGYFETAKAHARLVDNKSSGQQSQALQAKMLAALAGTDLPSDYDSINWSYGREPHEIPRQQWTGSHVYQAEALKKQFSDTTGGVPLILMDEPEQSLDARAEMQLWAALAAADCSRMQVIVATHSVYPLLHRGKFNIIEAEEGYAAQVLELMGGSR